MRESVVERVMKEAQYVFDTRNTIRKTAEIFGMSKSTVHHDISYKLEKIDSNLHLKIKQILEKNFAEKHIRGGFATRRKYKKDTL